MIYTNEEAIAFIEQCKEVHQGNVDRGFWENDRSNEELATLICTELMEAVEADRKGIRPNDISVSNVLDNFDAVVFKNVIKDTVEDEVADAAIRCMDYLGSIAIKDGVEDIARLLYSRGQMMEQDAKELNLQCLSYSSICEALGMLACMNFYSVFAKNSNSKDMMFAVVNTLLMLNFLSLKHYLNIENHIELKLKYNATRPYKHGKKY